MADYNEHKEQVSATPKMTAEQMRKQRLDSMRFDDLPTVGPKAIIDDRAETRVRADELDLAHYGMLVQVEGHVYYNEFLTDRDNPGGPKPRMWNVTGLLMGWRYQPVENLIELQIQQGNLNVHVYVTDDRMVTFA